MISFDEARISCLIYHHLACEEEETISHSQDLGNLDEDDEVILKKIFLKQFANLAETFEFHHNEDLELNPLFNLTRKFEESDLGFVGNSKEVLKHLQRVSHHPNIKPGDVFIVKFQDLRIKDDFVDGLGIYKVEQKEKFLQTMTDGTLRFQRGIGSQKIDKACLILFDEAPYTIGIIDNVGKETQYWKEEFINAITKKDENNATNRVMEMARTFIVEKIPEEYEVTKPDQMDLLNKSVDYFKTKESFNQQQFENEILQDPQIIESYRNYENNYREERDMAEPLDNFEISNKAVKKQSRIFKSVLKLDKNFHIYIHGNKEMIEQGMDEEGRKFYKIFYQVEN